VTRFRVGLAALALLLAGCTGSGDRVVVASKNFTEQTILAELVAQQIERRTDLGVDRRFFLGGTFVCHHAIIAGEIDVYVEYTGTALTAILERPPLRDPRAVYDSVRAVYRRQFQLTWGDPLGFDNTFAILIRGAAARDLGIETISEAVPFTSGWRAGFGYEFMEREDGYPGLAATYGLEFAETPRTMDLGLTYRALADGQVDLIAGNSTDGLIQALDLFQLRDDRKYFPPYEAAPVIRDALLQEHPELSAVLVELAGRISDDEMRRLNYLVDVEHRDLAMVVREWLEANIP
jgi:glycine betaine/choline ABC-type transport system substrate-binding protein